MEIDMKALTTGLVNESLDWIDRNYDGKSSVFKIVNGIAGSDSNFIPLSNSDIFDATCRVKSAMGK